MNSKDNIDKIDEQINNLIKEEKDIYEDTKDSNNIKSDNIEKTKKLDDVIEDKIEENLDSTKKLDNIEELDESNNENNLDEEVSEESTKEESDDKFLEDDSNIDLKVDSNNSDEEKNVIDKDFVDVKKNNVGLILIIVSFVAVMIFLVVFILFMFFGNEKKSDQPTKTDNTNKVALTKNEQKEIINKYGDTLKDIISTKIEKENKLLSYNEANKLVDFDYKVECNEHYIYDDGSIYLNKCKIEDIRTSYSYGEKQEKKEDDVVEDDDSIKVYVSKSDGESTLNEPKNLDDYDVYSFDIDGNYSSLTLLNDDTDYVFYYDENSNVQMINFKKNKKAFSSIKYTSILPIKYDDVFDNSVVAVLVNGKWGFYNLNTRERIIAHKYQYVAVNLNLGVSGPPLYIDAVEKGKVAVIEDGDYGVINYNNGNEIIPVIYSEITRSGNYLWVKDDEKVGHIFDYSGKEYLKDTFNDIYGIVDGSYVLVKDGKDLKLVKVNGKVYYNYGNLEYGNYNFGMKYKDGVLFQFYHKDNNNRCIEITYDSSTKTGDTKDVECDFIDIAK